MCGRDPKSTASLSGNTITFTPTGITSSSGPGIVIRRDGYGHVDYVEDPKGRRVTYTHGANGLEVRDRHAWPYIPHIGDAIAIISSP